MSVKPPGKMPDESAWLPDYVIQYRSVVTGAAVYEPLRWRFYPPSQRHTRGAPRPEAELAKERVIARLLAENGIDVVLRVLETGHEGKSPDAFLIRNGLVEVWEFKQLDDSATNAKNSANHSARDAKRQSGRLVYFIPRDIDAIGGVAAVNDGFLNALLYDTARLLKEIFLLWYDGSIERLLTDELRQGVRFSGLPGDD